MSVAGRQRTASGAFSLRPGQRPFLRVEGQLLFGVLLLTAVTLGAQAISSNPPSPRPPTPPRPPSPSPTPPSPAPPPTPSPSPSPRPPPSPKKPPSPPRPPPSPPKPPGKPRPPPRMPKPPQRPPALPPSPPRPPPSPPRTRNGVRLVRGSGRIGRLEVSFRQDYFPAQKGYTENGGWAPLCDDGSFGPVEAELFCQQLGYKTGRQIYGSGISDFAAYEEPTPTPLGRITCDSWPLPDIPIGQIAFADASDPTCFLFSTDCSQRVLVALQCSNSYFMSPNRPPPPAPSSAVRPPPSPPPPDMPFAIKVIDLEANLKYSGEDDTSFPKPGRVELLVNSSSDGRTGPSVWAPLCATAADLAWYDPPEAGPTWWPDPVANTSCNQYDPSTNTWNQETVGFIRRPVPIPSGVVASNSSALFSPAKYSYWVTVVGGAEESTYAIQAMQLQVSTTPCASGYMYSLICQKVVMSG